MKVQCLAVVLKADVFITCSDKSKGHTGYQSRLVLQVRTERGRVTDIVIDSFFKKNLGKLTEWRRTLIITAMPREVQVVIREPKDQKKYLEIVEFELESWLSNCYDPWIVAKAEKRMKNGKGKKNGNSKSKQVPVIKKPISRESGVQAAL